MAELEVKTNKIIDNINKISHDLAEHDIKWSLITKVFSGNIDFLKKILIPKVVDRLHSVGDSRLTSLRNIKSVNPDLTTIYIKPPAAIYAEDVVEYADISLNTSFETIQKLNEAAKKRNKVHKVIIMIELGELREGVLRENIIDFYERLFDFSNIKVIGIGSNLGCMYGVEPTFDKLLQLVLYKQLLEAKFNRKIELISGGSSITVPLITRSSVPPEVNHFRIGEAAFFGTTPYNNQQLDGLSIDTFNFNANIIELEEKDKIPDGKISDASIGYTSVIENPDKPETSLRAILDFGMLDVDVKDIEPTDKALRFVGTTSDMSVYDFELNKEKISYHVGHKVHFKPNYMAVARLLNSKFIETKLL